MKRPVIILAFILSTGIILGACADSSQPDQPDLEGTSWILTAVNGTPPNEGTQPTLGFEDGEISGNAGCNLFGGFYQVNDNAIEFTDLFSKEMFCSDPEGTMYQEQVYLDLLREAQNFELVNGRLIVLTESDQSLTFQKPETIYQPSPTPDIPDPTPVPSFQPPDGFKEYRDDVTGVSIFIPASWHVTGVIEGEYAILQSYPEDKYVGGEARQPGDAKCDLNIRPPGESEMDIIRAWNSSDLTTILSETEISLQSGELATRFELNSMGRANVLLAMLDERLVKLTCFGDFTVFDQIAGTLSVID